MGYFSQRKKHERENNVLKAMLVFLSITALLILLSGSRLFVPISNFRFQLFILTGIVFMYSVFHRRLVYAVYASILFVFYYAFVASHAHLFFNEKVFPSKKLEIVFSKDYEPDILSPDFQIQRAGKLNLSPSRQGYFATVAKDNDIYTIVSLNLTYLKEEEASEIYENLAEFVLQRDEPIIIAGNFGVPAWHQAFKNFLSATSLNVKNKILLRDNQGSFNPLITPRVNILGFDNTGIDNIKFIPNSRSLLRLQLDLH